MYEKKILRNFIFSLFAFTGIRNDLPTEFLPILTGTLTITLLSTFRFVVLNIPLKHTRASFLTSDVLDIS